MQSPCVRVCAIDAHTGLCTGCGRTLEEIAGWTKMTDEERERIISTLSDRLSDRRRETVGAAGR